MCTESPNKTLLPINICMFCFFTPPSALCDVTKGVALLYSPLPEMTDVHHPDPLPPPPTILFLHTRTHMHEYNHTYIERESERESERERERGRTERERERGRERVGGGRKY